MKKEDLSAKYEYAVYSENKPQCMKRIKLVSEKYP